MNVCHLETSIVDMFRHKLLENPYLQEIAHHFIDTAHGEPVYSNDLVELEKNIKISTVRISTMTVLCNLGMDINLESFYNNIVYLAGVTYTDDPDYYTYKRTLRKYILDLKYKLDK